MTVRIAAVTVDCADALAVGRFWSAALGRALDPSASSNFASIGFVGRRDTMGWATAEGDEEPTWMFVRVPEPKVAKNRIHLDVMSPDPAAEVARRIQLGGTQVSGCDGPRRTTSTWSWRRDPERNDRPDNPATGGRVVGTVSVGRRASQGGRRR